MSKRTEKMSVSGIREVFELGAKLENPINLSIGQPDFVVPEELKKSACQAIEKDWNGYSLTLGLPELRERVAEKLREENDIEWAKKENTIITSAVSGGLSVVLPTLIDVGDEVIIFDPYFVSYKQLILLYGGVPVMVKKNEDFSLNEEMLRQAISDKTKVIIINTPENPTGRVWREEELQMVVRVAEENNLAIIADEIYEYFIYFGKHFSVGAMSERVITLGGFSKSRAITGWRIGWLQASREIVEEVMKVQQYTFVCAPTPFQKAVLNSFDIDVLAQVKDYQEKGKLLYEGLKGYYQISQPEGAFYLFAKYPYDSEKFVNDCLAKNLLIVPGKVFSERDEYFRLSFVAPLEQIKKAVEILRKLSRHA